MMSIKKETISGNQIVRYIQRIPLWIWPLLISILLFMPVDELTLPADGVLYMSHALNLYKGYGYVSTDWSPVTPGRPGLPFLMMISFWLFSPSAFSAFLITRLFFVLTILLMYFLGARLYNKWVGLVASLFVLSSTSLNEWATYIHLDHIMPFFMLLFLLLTFLALEKPGYYWFVLAGLTLGLGYLVKEIALLFAPLPVMALILVKSFRTRKNLVGVLMLMSTLALIVFTWLGYIRLVLNSTEVSNVVHSTRLAGNLLNRYDSYTLSSPAWRYVTAFPNYYTQYLKPNFDLGFLMVVAWGFSFIVAFFVRKDKANLVVCSAGLLLLVIVLFQGTVGYRVRQSIVVFLLSYLVLASFLVELSWLVSQKIQAYLDNPKYEWVAVSPGVAIICTALIYQIAFERVDEGNLSNFVARYNTVRYLLQSDKIPNVTGWYGEKMEPVGQWLLNHIPPGSAILTDRELQAAIYFHTQGEFPVHFEYYPTFLSVMEQAKMEGFRAGYPGRLDKPLFIWFQTGGVSNLTARSLQVLFESDLLDEVEMKSIDYIIVPPFQNLLALYLLNNPGFVKVADFDHGAVQIFKVEDLRPSPNVFETQIESRVPGNLHETRQDFPALYEAITTDFFEDFLGWQPDKIRRIVNGNYPTIKFGQNSQETFANLYRSRPLGEVDDVITQYQEKLKRYPDNLWLLLILGKLYLIKKDVQEALNVYQQALNIDFNSPEPYLYLAEAYLAKGQLENEPDLFRLAVTTYRQSLNLAPDNSGIQEAIVSDLSTLNQEFLDQDLRSEIIAIYEQVIEFNPDYIGTYWELAEFYNISGETDKAIGIYAEIATRWSDQAATAYLFLGQAYETQGRIDRAIAEYETAIRLRPERSAAYIRLSNLYHAQNRTEAAIGLYHSAVANNPDAAWPHLQLGKLYLERAN